jgi:hypothetical protein
MEEKVLNIDEIINKYDNTLNINFIPKEKIKYNSKLFNNQDLSMNESSISCYRDQKCFYVENVTAFLMKEDFEDFKKVKIIV